MSWSNQQSAPISHETALIINDKTFAFSDEITVAISGTEQLHIKTGSKDVLIKFAEVSAIATECEITGWSCSTLTDDGTLNTIQPINMRCRGDETVASSVSVYHTPTVSDLGTRMSLDVAVGTTIAGGGGGRVAPASGGLSGQFLLTKNSSNIFQIVNRDASSATNAVVKMRWTEDEI